MPSNASSVTGPAPSANEPTSALDQPSRGDWEIVAPDGASVKRHMVLWRNSSQREYSEPARYIWKLEFQRRGAPHILLCGPEQARLGAFGVEVMMVEGATVVTVVVTVAVKS